MKVTLEAALMVGGPYPELKYDHTMMTIIRG